MHTFSAHTTRWIVAALALTLATDLAAGPIGWMQSHLLRKPGDAAQKPERAAPGPIALRRDAPVQFEVDATAPVAELPRGRSRYRRLELSEPIAEATLQIRVLAQESGKGRSRSVFKPLLYVLDDNGDVRESVTVEPLQLDMRPFQRTELLGCAKVSNLQKFLIATEGIDVDGAFVSGARDALKAASKDGFAYSTEAVKVKLPFAATGEMVVSVSATPVAEKRPCAVPKPPNPDSAQAVAKLKR